MKRFFFIVVSAWIILCNGIAQDISVSGIVNHYLAVDSILPDRVRVAETAELAYFSPGDKILIIQHTGGEVPDETYSEPFKTYPEYKFPKTLNQVGSFEVLQMAEIVEEEGDQYVVFTDNLTYTYDQEEKIQLVRFVEGDNITVTGTVTAQDWDGATGGIVAIIGMDSINLNADIDVSNQGYRGGTVPSENYTGGCRQDLSGTVVDTLYFLDTELNRSGNKGEGIITVNWPYTKGSAFALNGGGAGNGLYSGGGGGANYNGGGNGGLQSSACSEYLSAAWGGYGCYLLYSETEPKIVMGGGGGSGVKSSSATASAGGDGGGIVILITEILDCNGYSIASNGETAGSATGSGGGGGSGGTVLIDARGYGSNLNVYINGGDGGDTDDNCTGSGGGGSGGVLWYSGTSTPASTVELIGGSAGHVATSCVYHTGDGASDGMQLDELLMPLTGFLFNAIRGVDTICSGQIPGLLTGTQPKGGDGSYTFSWEQSTDQTNWISAYGTPTLISFQPDALSETTYFRRIVNSLDIADTSRVLEVYVYPAISDNILSGTDTICYAEEANELSGLQPSGGNSVFEYLWQISKDLSEWDTSGGVETANNPHDPGTLTETSYYRRIVTSTAFCTDTSEYVTITVLPVITNNLLVTADTIICENLGPGQLNATLPEGGDGSYSYSWQSRPESGTWQDISSSNMMRYDPGQLTQTSLFRRIVYSGNGQACIDTSLSIKTIQVLPAISNNTLETDSSRYCAGDVPLAINGLGASGGSGSYSFKWQQYVSDSWQDITGAAGEDYTPEEMVESDIEFRRIVISGTYDACIDTSEALTITVVPYIVNTLDLSDQAICQYASPDPLTTVAASGGFNGFIYEWIQQQEGTTEWNVAEGIADQYSYEPGELENSILYARKVYSDICFSISDTVEITVYPTIKNNDITGSAIQYTCYNTEKLLEGTQPADGKEGDYAFQWEQSDNGTDWALASESLNDARDYQTGALSDIAYYRRIVFSSASAQECADTSDMLEIRINPLPSGDVIGSKDTLCAGEILYANFTISGDNGPFTVVVGNGNLSESRSGITASLDSVALVLTESTQLVMQSIRDDSLCYADLSGNTGLIEAILYEVPVADAGGDREVCGEGITLAAVKSIPGSVGVWDASDVVFDDTADPVSYATANSYGTHVLTWKESNWQCFDEDEVEVIFYEQPDVPEAGENQELDFTYATVFEAFTPVVGTGSWEVVSGNGVFDDPLSPNASVVNLDDHNLFRWTVVNGVCEAVSDSVEVVVIPLEIPKGFTPNGDMKNDAFSIDAIHAEWIRIKIFDRSGVLVYESNNYDLSEKWEGYNQNGIELPEGTYFYVAEIKVPGREKEIVFKSFVEILR